MNTKSVKYVHPLHEFLSSATQGANNLKSHDLSHEQQETYDALVKRAQDLDLEVWVLLDEVREAGR